MLHSTRSGKPHSGANERLIGGRNLEKDLIVIREIRRTSRDKIISCINRLSNRIPTMPLYQLLQGIFPSPADHQPLFKHPGVMLC
jgi:hypothetical protein